MALIGESWLAGPSRYTHWIDVNGSGSVKRSVQRGNIDQMCGNAVMYDIGKILVFGGSANQNSGEAYSAAYLLDINDGDNVAVKRIGSMVHPRVFSSAVVLPDGDVLIAGGQTMTNKFSDEGTVYQAELWNSKTQNFSPMASMTVPRTYHSVCLLLKDARVICMGGGL